MTNIKALAYNTSAMDLKLSDCLTLVQAARKLKVTRIRVFQMLKESGLHGECPRFGNALVLTPDIISALRSRRPPPRRPKKLPR